MPRNIERDKREADRRKNQLIEAGFRLFSQNGIETVSLQKVADAANVSPATMYKYFLTKEKLLIAISAKVWDEVWQEALGDPGTNHFEHFTAYQGIEFYADRMIALYKNRPEVLRFSGEYKTYMNRRGNMEDKQLREHLDVLKPMQLLFHGMYERAKVDGSIRTDIPEEEMFITSSITMLSIFCFWTTSSVLEGSSFRSLLTSFSPDCVPLIDLFTLSSALESFVVSPPISTVMPWILDAICVTTSLQA